MRARLVLATSNAGKLREFRALLAPHGCEVIDQASLGIPDADEPHATFIENALAKARHASAASGLAALADDSGLCVAALDGAPGVHSARFAASETGAAWAGLAREARDRANNALLVRRLAEVADRRAHYYCAIVLVRRADDPEPIVAEGRWAGTLIDAPRGAGGFGYDPHFLVDGLGLTGAELPAERKNAISHRGRALATLLERLRAEDR